MKNYLNLLSNVVYTGETKENRTGVDTLACPPLFFEHNMISGFPLLTTKKMGMKSISAELEMFIKGITDKKWLQDRGCNIWNDWGNPEVLGKEIRESGNGDLPASEIMDLGPIYGYQWRRFGLPYSNGFLGNRPWTPQPENPMDQLAYAVNTLKTNPDDRRMVISAWNPTQLHQMALPPCHYAFTLQHINGKLSLNWSQRSVDAPIGLPFNIASYGLLLELIAKEAGMIPHMLTGNLIDVHVYKNQIEGVKKQLLRIPKKLPILILPEIKSIFDWKYTDFELVGYDPWPRISMPVAV